MTSPLCGDACPMGGCNHVKSLDEKTSCNLKNGIIWWHVLVSLFYIHGKPRYRERKWFSRWWGRLNWRMVAGMTMVPCSVTQHLLCFLLQVRDSSDAGLKPIRKSTSLPTPPPPTNKPASICQRPTLLFLEQCSGLWETPKQDQTGSLPPWYS